MLPWGPTTVRESVGVKPKLPGESCSGGAIQPLIVRPMCRWLLHLLLLTRAAGAQLSDALFAALSSDQKTDLLRQLYSGTIAPSALADAALAALQTGRRLAQATPVAVIENATVSDPLRAVLLFRKSETDTGQLQVEQEGLAVLQSQRSPFAIVSAVGPTRTGKSTILGRAFLRGVAENVFKIGDGVTSYTGGVWITNKPILVTGSDGRPLRVLLIDTEGFNGVGGVTSRAYESNLFGIIQLISSRVIFNSMFPVDASTVQQLNVWDHRFAPDPQGLVYSQEGSDPTCDRPTAPAPSKC